MKANITARFLLLVVSLAAPAAYGEIIASYTADCSATNYPGDGTISQDVVGTGGTGGCSVAKPYGALAETSMWAVGSVSGNGVTASASLSALAANMFVPGCDLSGGCSPESEASITGDIYLVLDTAGPLRSGVIVFDYLCGSDDDEGEAGGVGSITINTTQVCSAGVPSNGGNGMIDVELGADITIDLSAGAYATATGEAGSSVGDADLTLGVFEADGVTPVPLIDTPEPSSLALLGLPALFLLWRSIRPARQQHRRHGAGQNI